MSDPQTEMRRTELEHGALLAGLRESMQLRDLHAQLTLMLERQLQNLAELDSGEDEDEDEGSDGGVDMNSAINVADAVATGTEHGTAMRRAARRLVSRAERARAALSRACAENEAYARQAAAAERRAAAAETVAARTRAELRVLQEDQIDVAGRGVSLSPGRMSRDCEERCESLAGALEAGTREAIAGIRCGNESDEAPDANASDRACDSSRTTATKDAAAGDRNPVGAAGLARLDQAVRHTRQALRSCAAAVHKERVRSRVLREALAIFRQQRKSSAAASPVVLRSGNDETQTLMPAPAAAPRPACTPPPATASTGANAVAAVPSTSQPERCAEQDATHGMRSTQLTAEHRSETCDLGSNFQPNPAPSVHTPMSGTSTTLTESPVAPPASGATGAAHLHAALELLASPAIAPLLQAMAVSQPQQLASAPTSARNTPTSRLADVSGVQALAESRSHAHALALVRARARTETEALSQALHDERERLRATTDVAGRAVAVAVAEASAARREADAQREHNADIAAKHEAAISHLNTSALEATPDGLRFLQPRPQSDAAAEERTELLRKVDALEAELPEYAMRHGHQAALRRRDAVSQLRERLSRKIDAEDQHVASSADPTQDASNSRENHGSKSAAAAVAGAEPVQETRSEAWKLAFAAATSAIGGVCTDTLTHAEPATAEKQPLQRPQSLGLAGVRGRGGQAVEVPGPNIIRDSVAHATTAPDNRVNVDCLEPVSSRGPVLPLALQGMRAPGYLHTDSGSDSHVSEDLEPGSDSSAESDSAISMLPAHLQSDLLSCSF